MGGYFPTFVRVYHLLRRFFCAVAFTVDRESSNQYGWPCETEISQAFDGRFVPLHKDKPL